MATINLGDVLATGFLLLPIGIIAVVLIVVLNFIKRAEQRSIEKLTYERQMTDTLTEDLKVMNAQLNKIERLLNN